MNGIPKLGILAACQLDGSVSFYAVPQPKDIRQKTGVPEGETIYCEYSSLTLASILVCDWLTVSGQVDKPLLRLDIPDAMCNCIDWINGGRLACGTSTGMCPNR